MDSDKAYDIVVHNGTVVTVNGDFDVLEAGFVAIGDGRIEVVGKGSPAGVLENGRQVLDAKGGIILPGLVNAHSHSAMTLFRGLADDLPLATWLEDYIFKAEARWLNPDTVYTGSLLACAEMLLSGTTTCCDGYFFEDSVAGAVAESGMRAVVAQGIVDFPAPGVPDPERNVDEALAFIQKWQGRTPMITPGLFCHSPYTCSEKTLRRARKVADETDALFQIHVAETKKEAEEIFKQRGLSPVQYLDRIGILNARTLVVHAIWIDEEDMVSMAKKEVGVALTTESHMKLASGIAPVSELVGYGLTVGMGTDGCASNNNLDMFQEMDFMAKLHKARLLDPTAMDARQVLTMATRQGAEAIGLGGKIGSVEVGKRADLIIIDTHKPHLTPLYDPASHLVYSADGSDVRDVIVDGRVVVKDREVLTMRVGDVMDEVASLARKIAA
jgi:5-methylthioadenosine/S-adenosylhomocysteine deaminase